MIKKQIGNLSNGTFGTKELKFAFFNLNKKTTYIMAHGLYGSSYSDERYQDLVQKIIKSKLGNVFTYETSRLINFSKRNNLNFDHYQKAFLGKTFNDELIDVKKLFKYLVNNLLKKTQQQLVVVAFSLGGTISSFLLKQYKNKIKQIFLFGSGISTKAIHKPITSTYPQSTTVLDNFRNYPGEIYLIQGTNDIVVPLKPARKIITDTDQASKRILTIIKDIDHSFRYYKNKESVSMINNKIIDYLIANRLAKN